MKCMFAMGVLSSAARVVIGSSVQCGLRSEHLGICWKSTIGKYTVPYLLKT